VKFWHITDKFKEVDNPVWARYKKNNGLIEKYYFLRFLLMRGKHHPQMILSMAAEYALVIFIMGAFGIVITKTIVIVCTIILLILLLIIGYIDVYYDVARKASSFSARFSPEAQQLYRQVEEMSKEIKVMKNSQKQIGKTLQQISKKL